MSIDWTKLYDYNCRDAAVTIESWEVLQKELHENRCYDSYKFNTSLIEPLTYLSLRGIRLHEAGMKQLSQELEDEYQALREELKQLIGIDINPHSPKQLQAYFYVEKREKPYLSRTTGKMSVDEEALSRLARKGYPEAKLMIRMREIRKLKSSYLDIKYDSDGRMRCSYNPAGTSTGRLSSSKTIFGFGLNLQTVPKQARLFFVADKGMKLVECDLSQAEARVVAYLAGDPKMISVFESNGDIHQLTADLMKVDRQTAKVINHASNYAMGVGRLSLLLSCSSKEAAGLSEQYHYTYPGVRSVFHREVGERLRATRTLENLFGRRRLFMDRWSDDLLRAAYAYIPQSTVAEITNRGLVTLYLSNKYDLLAQVHDSILLQTAPDSNLQPIIDAMEMPLEYRGRKFIIPAEVKSGSNWRELN